MYVAHNNYSCGSVFTKCWTPLGYCKNEYVYIYKIIYFKTSNYFSIEMLKKNFNDYK